MIIFRVLVPMVALFLFAANSYAKTCEMSIEGNDAMQFNQKTMVVAQGCTEIKITLKHSGKLPKSAMGHNWLLALTKDMTDISTKGISAGLANNYVPKGDKRVIAHTKVVGGGESTSVTFSLSGLTKGADYSFFCTFPGHSAIMKGSFVYK
jgi:azurin